MKMRFLGDGIFFSCIPLCKRGKHAIQRLTDRWGYVSYDQPILIPGYIASQGSAPELRKWYSIAPADLCHLSAVLIEKEVETQFQSYFMNVCWSLSTDGKFVVTVAGGDPKGIRKLAAEGNARNMA